MYYTPNLVSKILDAVHESYNIAITFKVLSPQSKPIILFFIFLGEHHRNLGRKGCIRRDLLHGVASRTAWCRG